MSTRINPVTKQPYPTMQAAGGATMTAKTGNQVNAKTAGGAVTVRTPASPVEGATFAVFDESSNAGTNNITVSGLAGALIDGAASVVLNVNGTFACFVYDGGQWRRIVPRRTVDAAPDAELEFFVDDPAAVGSVTSVGATLPITSTGGATPTIGINAATPALPGSLSAADKTLLNAIAIVDFTATAPLARTAGFTPVISIPAASGVTAGSMSIADKNKLDGIQKQGVTTAMAALDVDWSLSGTYSKTLAAGANAITFSNDFDGGSIVVELTSDGGGSTVTWPAGVTWVGGVAPTQTPTGIDVYTFVRIGAAIRGSVIQGF